MRRHAPAARLSNDVLARLEDAEGDDGLTLILGPDGDEINLDARETKALAVLLNGNGEIAPPPARTALQEEDAPTTAREVSALREDGPHAARSRDAHRPVAQSRPRGRVT